MFIFCSSFSSGCIVFPLFFYNAFISLIFSVFTVLSAFLCVYVNCWFNKSLYIKKRHEGKGFWRLTEHLGRILGIQSKQRSSTTNRWGRWFCWEEEKITASLWYSVLGEGGQFSHIWVTITKTPDRYTCKSCLCGLFFHQTLSILALKVKFTFVLLVLAVALTLALAVAVTIYVGQHTQQVQNNTMF